MSDPAPATLRVEVLHDDCEYRVESPLPDDPALMLYCIAKNAHRGMQSIGADRAMADSAIGSIRTTTTELDRVLAGEAMFWRPLVDGKDRAWGELFASTGMDYMIL